MSVTVRNTPASSQGSKLENAEKFEMMNDDHVCCDDELFGGRAELMVSRLENIYLLTVQTIRPPL
jgi:hypothetical protein